MQRICHGLFALSLVAATDKIRKSLLYLTTGLPRLTTQKPYILSSLNEIKI